MNTKKKGNLFFSEYFARVILCNSLLWACSVTGKINLTFEEALESERQAKKTLVSVEPHVSNFLYFPFCFKLLQMKQR